MLHNTLKLAPIFAPRVDFVFWLQIGGSETFNELKFHKGGKSKVQDKNVIRDEKLYFILQIEHSSSKGMLVSNL